jgi:alanine-synthesizing transaminase
MRASGKPLLDLTVSNPTTCGIPYDEEAILGALRNPRALRYEPLPFGLASAREAVAGELGIGDSNVVLTASTSEAYAFLFKLLCDPGDSVLVAQPSYPLFEHLATFESVRLSPYPLEYDGAWHIDMDALRRRIDGRTRAILIVNPNNPTGSFLKRWEYDALAELKLPIVSDEVFATYGFGHDAERVTSVLEAERGLVFSLGGLSKLAALPQMKAAWIAVGGPAQAKEQALARLELIADSFLSVSTPVQLALPALLRARRTTADAIVRRTRRNLEHLAGALSAASSPATLLRAEGGWYATLRLPRTRSEEAWVLGLLEEGVYVHPGAFFDFSEEAFVIVSLLTPEDTFDAGVERILTCAARA